MGRYDFVAPVVTPSITQDIAGALQTGLGVYRQRRADAANDQERQMGDAERGWAPAGTNSTAATPSPDAASPDSVQGFSPAGNDGGAIPSGAAQVAPSAGGALASSIASVRQQADPMAGNDESAASRGPGSMDDDAVPVSGPAPTMNLATGNAKTSSGMPADTRTGDAPNATDVRVGNMTYDFRRSTQGQQMQFVDQLGAARERRAQAQADNDRNRKATDLVGAGFTPGQAAAMADGSIKAGDVQVSPDTAASLAGSLQRERDSNATSVANEATRSKTDLQVAGMRERGEMTRAQITHQDQHDGAIDRYVDDATQGYGQSVTRLNTLQNSDPRQFSNDPAVVAQWTADVASAQSDLNTQHARMKTYQGVADSRTKALTGTDVAPTTAAPRKAMSPSQSQRSQRDPQYRAYLEDQGYDTTAPQGGFNFPFRMQ